MTKHEAQIFGDAADLEALELALSGAGFSPQKQNLIQASEAAQIKELLIFAIGMDAGKCIRTYLQERSNRLVARHGDKVVIRGDFSTEEIETLLKASPGFNIEDDKKRA